MSDKSSDSNTPTTDASSDGKGSSKEESKTAEAAIGPLPPTDDEYDPAEL